MDKGGDQWIDAALKPAIVYARGSKLLKLPDSYRAVIPNSI